MPNINFRFNRIPETDLICPYCKTSLSYKNSSYHCNRCNMLYPIMEGIHLLLPTVLDENKKAEQSITRKKWTSREFKYMIAGCAMLPLIPADEGKILEIGAGPCYASYAIKKHHPKCLIYATDVSINQLRIGKNMEEQIGYNIDYYAACDIERLPFKDNYFDVVYGQAVLHHINSPYRAFKEILRVLKLGGIYAGKYEVMCSRLLHSLHHKISSMSEREEMQGIFERTYTYHEWESFIKKSGFKDYKIIFDNKPNNYQFTSKEWFYYKITSRLPRPIIKYCFSTPLTIIAQKPT